MDSDFADEPFALKLSALTLNTIYLLIFVTLEYRALTLLKWAMQRSALALLCAFTLCELQRVIFDAIRLAIDG